MTESNKTEVHLFIEIIKSIIRSCRLTKQKNSKKETSKLKINNIRTPSELKKFDKKIKKRQDEHVLDIKLTLKEAFGVLKNKGKLVFSIPFYLNKQKTERCAIIKNDKFCIRTADA